MSKFKVSFSLFFAIFLVGILSTAAFAHSAWNLSVSPDGTGGFNFSFDKTYQPSDPTTAFQLNVYSVDPATQALGTTPVFTKDFTYDGADANSHKVDVTKAGATPNIAVGTLYDFVLSTGGNVIGEKFGVLTESHNLKLGNVADAGGNISYAKADGTTVTLDIKGSGLANSNHTGADSKKKPGQSTHGFYQNNTNSCAVCHQTHTSDDSSGNLLMKNGVYSTCSACHDGTTGAYNAFEEPTAEAADSIVGTFNVGYDATHNGSIHDADGSLKLTAAPGGNSASGSKFDSTFDCASCHNPHGGGSVDENNLNQDPLSWGATPYDATSGDNIAFHSSDGTPNYTTTKDNAYGKLFLPGTTTIYTPGTLPTTKGSEYIFVLNAAGVDLSTMDQTTAEYYYLSKNGYISNKPILQTYRWQGSNSKYIPDFSLWLQEKGYPYKADTALYNVAAGSLSLTKTNNYVDGSKDVTRTGNATTGAGVNVAWNAGFAWGDGVAAVQSIQVSLGVDVPTTQYIQTLYQTDFTKQATDSKGNLVWLDSPTNTIPKMVSYIPDSGVAMSKYCASCHTDYLSITRKDNTGVYTQAHRHMTLADETNCIRCHYGHGTDASIMHDANDSTQFTTTDPVTGAAFAHTGDLSYFSDVNKSSALKRYTGMSVCYACHGQGEQFLSNPNNTHPIFGKPGEEGRSATIVPDNQ